MRFLPKVPLLLSSALLCLGIAFSLFTKPAATQTKIRANQLNLGDTFAFTGTVTCHNLQNIRCAAQFAGSDWCAKVTSADSDLSTTPGEIWLDQSAGTSACVSAPTLSSNHTLRVIQAGTYPISVGWTINLGTTTGWNIFGPNRASTIFSFTGSSGFTVTGPNSATAGPRIEGVKFIGNSGLNCPVVTLTQVWRGQWDFSAGTCTGAGYAVVLAGSLLNTGRLTVSGNEGAFGTIPGGGVQLTNSGAINANDNDIYYVLEGITGNTGLNIHNGTGNIVRGTSEGNGRGIQIDLASGTAANVILSMDTESNSIEDILDGANYDVYISGNSTSKIHFTGNNNRIQGGEYNNIQIDSGAKGTVLDTAFNSSGSGTVTDNGTNTQILRLFNTSSTTFSMNPFSFRDTIPPSAVSGIGTPDSGDLLAGTYTFTTTNTVLSNTVVTASKPWRVLFIGQWSNNFEGGGLVEIAPIVEFTSASPTVAIGTPTLTISLNGSNQFQAVTSANIIGFSGRIFIISNNLGAAGTTSALFKGDVQIATVGTAATSTVTTAGTQTLTNKTLNVPLPSGTGLQIFNTTTTCTTGASVGATCTTAAISLPVAEADASYRVVATCKGPTAVPVISSTANSSATQFTITIAALTAVAASCSSFDVMAGHN